MLAAKRLMALLLLTACSAGAQEDAAGHDDAALVAELSAHAEAMVAAVRARQPELVATFYDSAGGFVHYENGQAVTWAELAPQMRRFMESAARIDLFWVGSPSVQAFGRDGAVVHGVHRFEGALHDGTVLTPHTGTWTGVLRRRDGTWKLIHSHSSDAHP